MNRTLVIFLAIATLFVSCKKQTFTHTAKSPDSCPQCTQTDELEGNYRGRVSGPSTLQYYSSTDYPFNYDSMTVSVKHVFFDQGAYIDSTAMYLRFSIKFDHNPDTVFEIQRLRSDFTFAFKHTQHTIHDYSFISVDSLIINRHDISGNGSIFPFFQFNGTRIP